MKNNTMKIKTVTISTIISLAVFRSISISTRLSDGISMWLWDTRLNITHHTTGSGGIMVAITVDIVIYGKIVNWCHPWKLKHWKGYLCLYIIFMNQSVLLDNLLFVYLLILDVVPLTKSMYWASCTNILLVRVNKLELNYWEVGEVECKERQSWVVWRLGRPS